MCEFEFNRAVGHQPHFLNFQSWIRPVIFVKNVRNRNRNRVAGGQVFETDRTWQTLPPERSPSKKSKQTQGSIVRVRLGWPFSSSSPRRRRCCSSSGSYTFFSHCFQRVWWERLPPTLFILLRNFPFPLSALRFYTFQMHDVCAKIYRDRWW